MKRRPIQDRKYHYLYRIDRHDGKYYIGIHSTDVMDDGCFGSGERLWKSINYHGKNNHTKTIVETFESREKASNRERELVTPNLIKNDKKCLNLVPGGSYHSRKPDKAEGGRKKSAALKKFYMDPIMSAEARKKISEGNKGKQLTEDHKAVLSKTLTSTVARLKESGDWARVLELNRLAHIGKKQSDETVSKRNASIKKTKDEKYGGKYTFSVDARKNIGDAQIGNEKHAKTWRIVLITGETLMIKNIAKWYRETGVIHRKDGVTLKNESGDIIGRREKLGSTV